MATLLEDLYSKFRSDYNIKYEMIKYLHQLRFSKLLNSNLINKLILLINNDDIIYGVSSKSNVVALFLKPLVDIVMKLTKVIIPFEKGHIAGFYSRTHGKIVVVADDITELNDRVKLYLLFITLHELSHMQYDQKTDKFYSVGYDIFDEFYGRLLTKFSLVYKRDYNKVVNVESVVKYFVHFVHKIYITERTKQKSLQKDDLLQLLMEDSVRYRLSDNLDFIKFVYGIGEYGFIDDDRRIYDKNYQGFFYNTYLETFKPNTRCKNFLKTFLFYQELSNISEIVSIISPCLVGKGFKKHYITVLKLMF